MQKKIEKECDFFTLMAAPAVYKDCLVTVDHYDKYTNQVFVHVLGEFPGHARKMLQRHLQKHVDKKILVARILK